MSYSLRISKGEQAGRELALGQGELRIGRGPENELVLPDAGVSRRHARIYGQGAKLLVEDVGSANGTELNGALLQGPHALEDGDCISLGPVELVFAHAAADNADATAPAMTGSKVFLRRRMNFPRTNPARRRTAVHAAAIVLLVLRLVASVTKSTTTSRNAEQKRHEARNLRRAASRPHKGAARPHQDFIKTRRRPRRSRRGGGAR